MSKVELIKLAETVKNKCNSEYKDSIFGYDVSHSATVSSITLLMNEHASTFYAELSKITDKYDEDNIIIYLAYYSV